MKIKSISDNILSFYHLFFILFKLLHPSPAMKSWYEHKREFFGDSQSSVFFHVNVCNGHFIGQTPVKEG